MRALVIGGNGFIGSHLVDRLHEMGWEILILDINQRRFDPLPPKVHFIQGDLTQLFLLREALADVDIVFHLAWTTIHEISNLNPAADVEANLISSIHLIEACQQANVKRVVYISSGGTVYGAIKHLPIRETHPQEPLTSYGITKLAVEKYLFMFNQLVGIDYTILRPSVPYGPRQNPLSKQGAVAVFLYRTWRSLPITIWGDGKHSRDYFFISDLIDALITCATRKLEQQRVFNIGGAREITLLELIDQIEKTTGSKAIINYQPGRIFDARRIVLDTHLAQKELGWFPKVSLDEGLLLTWDWMKSNLT